MTRSRRAAASVAALALALVVAGCGAGSGGQGGMTVRAAQFPWSAAQLTTAILTDVVRGHPELGVGDVEKIQVGPPTAWAGAQRGDVDLLTEVAMPNQEELAAKAEPRFELIHPTYQGAEQGWFVPTYALAPGQPLAGLRSVTQLNEYAAALNGELVDSDPSFLTTEQNAKRIAGYRLDLEQVTSSEAAQIAELRRAYERRAPILVYLYRPHYVFGEFDMTKLEEPVPSRPDCFTTGDGGCAMPAYSAWSAASTDLAAKAPRFRAFLDRFEIPVPDIEEMLTRVDVDNEDVEVVARDFVASRPELVRKWVGTP